jgi:hypothetical protein
MSIGEKIIDEIGKQRMFRVAEPDPDASHLFVWSSSAAEQLEALIAAHDAQFVEMINRLTYMLREVGAPMQPKDSGEIADWILKVKHADQDRQRFIALAEWADYIFEHIHCGPELMARFTEWRESRDSIYTRADVPKDIQ